MTAAPGARRGVHVLRHGESTANAEGIIVSLPGPAAFETAGLTPRGREQAAAVGAQAREEGFDASTIVLSSDFARALQTAQEFAAQLGAAAPRIDRRLRERGFGRHDGGSVAAYETVWEADAARRDPGEEVEPVAEVAARLAPVLREAESLAAQAPVVLVAHGDVLQIALTIAAGEDPHAHRSQPHLGNAELRELAAPLPS